jgi:hypothetical protein
MLTWREVYNDEIGRQANELRAAKARGQTWLVIQGRTYDPSRMSEATIRQLAQREAERITNTAINVEIEAARAAGRSADLE